MYISGDWKQWSLWKYELGKNKAKNHVQSCDWRQRVKYFVWPDGWKQRVKDTMYFQEAKALKKRKKKKKRGKF